MTGHIIRPFIRMGEVRIILWHETLNETFQITTSRGIGIFHDY